MDKQVLKLYNEDNVLDDDDDDDDECKFFFLFFFFLTSGSLLLLEWPLLSHVKFMLCLKLIRYFLLE